MSDSTKKDIGFSLEYMDKSTDPRDDFYRFAAGKWIDTHPLPPDLPSIGAFRELSELNLDYLHEIARDAHLERVMQDFMQSLSEIFIRLP
jgi:Predicted metalloendopeptidase